MAELGAFFGNPNIQRQGARARALAGQRDVNTLADPRTYAIVQGLLGTAPDQMGLSVLNPDYEKIRKAAEPAFALGLLGQAAPLLAPMTKGLPVGASVKNVGTKLRVKPPTDDVYEVMDATFDFGKLGGNKTLPIDQLTGGVRMTDPKEVKRVKELAEKISSPDGYISRIVVDDLGNVLEGQHRFEALKMLGEKNVPVTVIEDLSNKYDIPAMRKALEGKFRSDETRQLLKHSIDTLEEAGSIDKALSDFAMPARYQKPFEDAIKASKVKVAPRQEALDKAQRNAALPVEEQPMQGLLNIAKRDASDIFGAGAQRIRYTDPRSGGSIDVLARPDNTASVLGLEVPETFRGQGIGGLLQSRVLQEFPDMQGQVSSKAAATTAYRLGRRPPNMPDATLDDVYKMIDENSSVNLVSPKMQQRIAPIPETEEEKLLRSLLE